MATKYCALFKVYHFNFSEKLNPDFDGDSKFFCWYVLKMVKTSWTYHSDSKQIIFFANVYIKGLINIEGE